MSGRRGVGVSTDEVIDLAVSQAYEVVREKRGHELTSDEMTNIAEAVGVGAVRFAMLRKNPGSQVLFDPDELLTFTGYTSLYLQYSYVRAASILAKGGEEGKTPRVRFEGADLAILRTADEKELVLRLSQLPSVVRQAAEQMNPSLVCQYGYDVAQAFSRFYKTAAVLGAPEDLRRARLQLVASAATVQRVVMGLLGVPVLERM